MELNQEIQNALIEINFVEKYKKISNNALIKYNETEKKMSKIYSQEIIELLERLGIQAKFIKKESFYRTNDISKGDYSFRMHFSFNYDFVECIWVVQKNNNILLGEFV